ncbi:hypothetical protein RJT34_18641 [Clitoria ternatea]|uniref:Uncharacterized protein n=1 Tax=Clitoria ternatea TaxID=43366 RepID=A0AAN9PFM3_CLITE
MNDLLPVLEVAFEKPRMYLVLASHALLSKGFSHFLAAAAAAYCTLRTAPDSHFGCTHWFHMKLFLSSTSSFSSGVSFLKLYGYFGNSLKKHFVMMNRKFGGGKQPTGTPSLALSCVVVVFSLLAGASVVHNVYKPNLTLPPIDGVDSTKQKLDEKE